MSGLPGALRLIRVRMGRSLLGLLPVLSAGAKHLPRLAPASDALELIALLEPVRHRHDLPALATAIAEPGRSEACAPGVGVANGPHAEDP